jgi:hypothetical protein
MEQIILSICLVFSLGVSVFLMREDWFHLTRPSQPVLARVVGHRKQFANGSANYAALLAFPGADGQLVEVEDKLLSTSPTPDIGTIITLHHPEGMATRARIKRPWLRAGVYLLLLYLNAVLIGRVMGWLSAGGS